MQDSAVQIFVRFRPVHQGETKTTGVHFSGDQEIVVDDSVESHEPVTPVSGQSHTPRSAGAGRGLQRSNSSRLASRRLARDDSLSHVTRPRRSTVDGGTPSGGLRTLHGGTFRFHRVLDEEATNDDLYAATGPPLMDAFFRGMNVTCMAYGASGSGKTHSMSGYFDAAHPERQGVIPRLLAQIFRRVDERRALGWETTVQVSSVQIYMEKVLDLFVARQPGTTAEQQVPLAVRERLLPNKRTEIYVEGVTWRAVTSAAETLKYIEASSANRVVTQTGMNDVSSRSHMVFMVHLEQVNSQSAEHLSSKAFLVDLAGSETVSRSGAEGKTLRQAIHVNKSLSTLGNVIKALSTPHPKHVPYRDSKLTRLLTNSLGGNSKTVILLACSMSVKDLGYTVSTLNFGKRASTMPNKPTVNKVLTLADYRRLLAKARREIEEQKLQLEALRRQNARLTQGSPPRAHEVSQALLEATKDVLSEDDSLAALLMDRDDDEDGDAAANSGGAGSDLQRRRGRRRLTFVRTSSSDDDEDEDFAHPGLDEVMDAREAMEAETPGPVFLSGRTVDLLSRSSAGLSEHMLEVVQDRNHELASSVQERNQAIELLQDQLVELRDALYRFHVDAAQARAGHSAESATREPTPDEPAAVAPSATVSPAPSSGLSTESVVLVSVGSVAAAAALSSLAGTQAKGSATLVTTWVLVVLLAVGTLLIGLAL